MKRKRLTRHESRLMTQAMLIDAAEEVFLREGFENTSIESISEAAGFSRGAFYSNFRDKEDLALAVIDKRRRDVACTLKDLRGIPDPLRRQAAFRDWFAKECRRRDWITLRAELSRRAVLNPALSNRLTDFCRQEIQTIARSFPAGTAVPAVTALALIAASHGIGSMAFHASPDLDELGESAIRLLFDRLTMTEIAASLTG